ncbi:unnamed protein product [Urochloa decumbens]|uniref:C2H2-type domain-containing protein n=1 Tax=Urochloa decumbens TaxID=240449 RepID=A0ABC8YWN4_9POAL
MDPSGYPTKHTSSSQSDYNISPLHQSLRGKKLMPTLSSTTYYGTIEAPPPQPYPVFTPIPPTSAVASEGIIQSPVGNEQDIMRTFLTIPVGNFLSVDERVQVASMEPPLITSLLQGNKTAILHAHLDIAGVLDPGPIFEDPASHIPKEKEMCKPLGSSASYGDPYAKMAYAKPTYFGQSPMSSFSVQREQQVPSVFIPSVNSHDAIGAAMSSKFEFKRVQQYKCQLCNATFTTPETYHGHMNMHNMGKYSS